MSNEETGVFLLKRWDSSKGVDHYAIGINGWAAWRSGSGVATIVQLLPAGIAVESWDAGAGWRVLDQAGDPEGALERLERASGSEFSLLNYNCEHFARDIVCGKRESRQVQIGIAAAASLVAVLLLARR